MNKSTFYHAEQPPAPLRLLEFKSARLGFEIKLFFAWFDLWIGAFYDRKKKILYLAFLPTLVFAVNRIRPTVKCEIKISRYARQMPIEAALEQYAAKHPQMLERIAQDLQKQMQGSIDRKFLFGYDDRTAESDLGDCKNCDLPIDRRNGFTIAGNKTYVGVFCSRQCETAFDAKERLKRNTGL